MNDIERRSALVLGLARTSHRHTAHVGRRPALSMTRPVERVRSAGSACGGRAWPCRPWGSVVGVDVGYAVSVSSGRGGVDPGMGEGELVLEGMAGCHGD